MDESPDAKQMAEAARAGQLDAVLLDPMTAQASHFAVWQQATSAIDRKLDELKVDGKEEPAQGNCRFEVFWARHGGKRPRRRSARCRARSRGWY